MTLFFDKSRGRWKYDFRLGGVRFQGYALDGAGEPVASKSAARQAEGVARRKAAIAGKVADPRAVTIGQVVAALQPRWQRSATWSDRKRQARELLEFFKPSTPVRDIDADRIRAYTDFAIARPIEIWIQG